MVAACLPLPRSAPSSPTAVPQAGAILSPMFGGRDAAGAARSPSRCRGRARSLTARPAS
jgi:hypothetical protein